jgi:hypothetical protein
MFRVPSLNGLRKKRRHGTVKEARCSVLSPKFLPKVFQKKFGKNIDGAVKRVLLRPSQDGGSTKVESAPVSGGETLGSFGDVLLKKFFECFRKKC